MPPTVYDVIRPATVSGHRGRRSSRGSIRCRRRPHRVVRRATRRAPPPPAGVLPRTPYRIALRHAELQWASSCTKVRAINNARYSADADRLEGDLGDPRRFPLIRVGDLTRDLRREHGRGQRGGVGHRCAKEELGRDSVSSYQSPKARTLPRDGVAHPDPDDHSEHQNPGREARAHGSTLEVTDLRVAPPRRGAVR